MRKFLLGIIILSSAILLAGPFFTGLLFQKKYNELVSFYNSQDNIYFKVMDYQRGWFSSDIFLQIIINPQKKPAAFQEIADFPVKSIFIIKQHVQHGPVIYQPSKQLPNIFALAMVENRIKFPADLAVFLQSCGINTENIQLENLVSYFGNYLNYLAISEVKLRSEDGDDINLKGLSIASLTKTDANSFTLKVEQLQIAKELIGALKLHMIFNQFDMNAISDLLKTFAEVIQNGEVYQGQLRKKIMLSLPKAVKKDSFILLDQFDLTAPAGKIKINGAIAWPGVDFTEADNFRELVMNAQVELNIVASKELIAHWINLSAQLPDVIHDVAEPDQDLLLVTRNNLRFAMQQYEWFVEEMLNYGYISKDTADELMEMQLSFMPLDDYTESLKQLLLAKRVSLLVSYYLGWQYTQIQKPYQFLLAKVETYKKNSKEKIQNQLNNLLKEGYIKEDRDEYSVLLKWINGEITSNGHTIK